ncbi:MAG: hypothetical protein Q7R41_13040 [Phycisphaerales bacterium]|nr:hypothetical protein [Phycisphaerales bacterium]
MAKKKKAKKPSKPKLDPTPSALGAIERIISEPLLGERNDSNGVKKKRP